MSQIALPLLNSGTGDPGRIVVGNANEHVIDALRQPDNWPFKTAILTGEPRSGKSMLGRWFAAQGDGDVIDSADAMEETDLFHRWNRAQEAQRPLLLICDGAVWDITLPDLKSRLGAAMHLEIGTPDDAMAAELMQNFAGRRGLALGDGALTYLVPRAERSFAAIERLVEVIDRLTLERKAPATLGIWRDALEAVLGSEQPKLL
ncbi:ATPase [Altererythrobacter sp. RZ02]|uniref:ATPase n=1 Tax=Pontixanthobacter rizhaonensis TaxID=2730337 RepID=A0A848QE33_9SPHN|nr:ATPase [Pontixanthobacter rizhaonensis]NMW31901.1 ATPase [Pontixanthobacter rizhaonensis]